jgi:predicted small metal-binding protein
MLKSLNCRDVEGARCNWCVCGHTEEEILEKAREHARKEHDLNEIPKEFMKKARAAIRQGC